MPKIELPWEEVVDIDINEGVLVEMTSTRWGTSQTRVIPYEGKHYRFTVDMVPEEGWQFERGGKAELEEVREIEKVVKAWEKVE